MTAGRMLRPMKRVGTMAIAAAAVLAATAPPATAAKRPRPTDVPPAQVFSEVAPNACQGFNDYATAPRFDRVGGWSRTSSTRCLASSMRYFWSR